jgi:UPF0755 protein
MFSSRGFILNTLVTIVVAIIFFASLYHVLVAAPSNFPAPYDLTVTSGETSSTISRQLANDGVIRSRQTFQLFMVALGNDTHISEGEYYFSQPMSAIAIALRLSGEDFGISKTKVTFPEGYTNEDMANRLKVTFPNFDSTTFLKLTENSQGYLFPDTYKFFATPQPSEVITTLKNNYTQKLAPLEVDIAASGHTEAEIVTMASLIEKEASGSTDSPVIAGILWKRIADGIALQVDAVPGTYHYKGLPPTPIDNPGLVAIEAAIHPTASPYLYYLHDSNGNIHYASTYQQHQQNIKKYLQ